MADERGCEELATDCDGNFTALLHPEEEFIIKERLSCNLEDIVILSVASPQKEDSSSVEEGSLLPSIPPEKGTASEGVNIKIDKEEVYDKGELVKHHLLPSKILEEGMNLEKNVPEADKEEDDDKGSVLPSKIPEETCKTNEKEEKITKMDQEEDDKGRVKHHLLPSKIPEEGMKSEKNVPEADKEDDDDKENTREMLVEARNVLCSRENRSLKRKLGVDGNKENIKNSEDTDVKNRLQIIKSSFFAQNSVEGSKEMPSKAPEEKKTEVKRIKIKFTEQKGKEPEDFVSEDAQENKDNNNPEWAYLKLLATDEARYKAVRERWRNLVIPNPNRNLSRIHLKKSHCRMLTERPQNARKRTHTFEPSSDKEVTAKRCRTLSCTTSYDIKLESMHKAVEKSLRDLVEKQNFSIGYAQLRFKRKKFNLMSSGLRDYDAWEFNRRCRQIHMELDQAVNDAHKQCSGALDSLEMESKMQLRTLESAAKEVEKFHKFYRKLDADSGDCFFLTPEEEGDVFETDDFYEKMDTFYR